MRLERLQWPKEEGLDLIGQLGLLEHKVKYLGDLGQKNGCGLAAHAVPQPLIQLLVRNSLLALLSLHRKLLGSFLNRLALKFGLELGFGSRLLAVGRRSRGCDRGEGGVVRAGVRRCGFLEGEELVGEAGVVERDGVMVGMGCGETRLVGRVVFLAALDGTRLRQSGLLGRLGPPAEVRALHSAPKHRYFDQIIQSQRPSLTGLPPFFPPSSCTPPCLLLMCLSTQNTELQQQKNQSMFYSPTKEFVRFSSYRTAQIKALKDRIQKEKVTTEEISATQMRLEKLRAQYDLLQQENHGELRDVLQSSEAAIAELTQEKAGREREAAEKGRQVEELEALKMELQEKGSALDEQLRAEVAEREHLDDLRSRYEQSILLLDKQYDSLARDLTKQQALQQDLRAADADLAAKWDGHRQQADLARVEREQLTKRIAEEREEAARQQKEWELAEKELERQEALREKGRLADELLRLKIDALLVAKTRQAETARLLSEEREAEAGLEEMAASISEETSRMEREEVSCQRQIKELLIKLGEEESTKCRLEEKINAIKSNLRLLKEKNENLKNKMNSIFRNDSELIKTISNKKVFPNCKPELLEAVKKTTPFATKENLPLPAKADKLELVSPRAFAEPNRIV